MQGAENIENSAAGNTRAWLRTILACLLLASLTAAAVPLAWVLWESRADLRGAIAGARLAADRTTALIGEPDSGAPVTLARLVATADGTVLLVRPVLEESAATVRVARQPLQAAAETIHAVRPVLGAAQQAIERTGPLLDATTAAVAEAGQVREDLRPVLADVDELVQQASSTVALIRPQALGLTAAAKVTAGHSAQIAREGAKVAPQVAENAAAITKDVRTVTKRMASPWGVVVNVLRKIKDWIL